jgi:hypothetical protein
LSEWEKLWDEAIMHNDYEGQRDAFHGLVLENKQLKQMLQGIERYPPEHWGRLSVIEYYELVQLQADTYTKRANEAEQKLEAINKVCPCLECVYFSKTDGCIDWRCGLNEKQMHISVNFAMELLDE